MCGRFTLNVEPKEIEKEFAAVTEQSAGQREENQKRFNIAPSQVISVIRQFETERVISGLKWGLVPSWAKEESIGNRMINARAESLAEKPSFRNAFKARRCLIPSSGFYEWKRLGDKAGKQPFYFYLPGKPVFGFAGLWETWKTEAGAQLESCTIITTTANAVLAPVHDRMPVIIKPEAYAEWLDPKEMDADYLQKFLAPFPAEEMQSHAVSRQVNSPTFDAAELIDPLELNSK
jgi:putative SOS response-associated peptidase YedK